MSDKENEPSPSSSDPSSTTTQTTETEGSQSDPTTGTGSRSSVEEQAANAMDMLKELFGRFGLSKHPAEEEWEQRELPEQLLSELTVNGVADYIKSEKCSNIIVMCGAGISTAAGIPDFRSPGTGLYDNLQKYDLPSPQSIFEKQYFLKNPQPFYTLAKELYPGKFKPTWSHYFVKLLEMKGLLRRVYTQNIDTLERVAGISSEKIVEAHGTFHTAHCVDATCNKQFSQDWVKEKIFNDEIPHCEECESLVKPDIVFFGEGLPKRFFDLRFDDFQSCDLLIIMGTSLKVQPFAGLVTSVNETTPRLLINREKCGTDGNGMMMRMLGMGCDLDFDSDKAYRDVALLGDCEHGCKQLTELLGWSTEYEELVRAEHARIDRESSAGVMSPGGTSKKKA